MTDTAFTWDSLDTEQPAAPVEAVEPSVSPTKETVKKRIPKPAKATAAGKRSNQVKFYITDAELEKFNQLRGAIPASAFLYSQFQDILK